MNHETKIRKLANAVRAYRGIGEISGGKIQKWHSPPQPDKQKRIRELLALLRFDGEEQENAIKKIDGFQMVSEFDAWIKEL